jgi:phosphatidylglycerol:prolipoprotein diacylglycerol transferase
VLHSGWQAVGSRGICNKRRMIPYFEVGPFEIGAVRIYPFGVMVACTLLTWLAIVLRRAGRMGLDPRRAVRLLESMLAAGVIGALLWAGAYNLAVPGRSARYASFGGVFGSLAGAALYFYFAMVPAERRWSYLDLLAYAFPFGWTFLRLGCTLAHDHPGRHSGSWLAVQFPDGPRYDLGLLEMLASLAVACTFAVLGRQPRPPGFFLRWIVLCGPIRVALDFLRENPAGFRGLTADRIGGAALTAAGVWIVIHARKPAASRPSRAPS